MECRFCRATNAEDDHRCHRCGRRLRTTPSWPGAGEVHASRQSPVPVYAIQPQTEQSYERAPEPARRATNWQPSLFSSREMPRVVPFESIAPAPLEPATRKSPSRLRTRKPHPAQQSLDLASAREMNTSVEAVIYCDAPVAMPVHRILAVALDGSIIAIALGLFLLTFRLASGDILLNRHTIPLYLGIAVVFAILYKVLWALADGDSAGMHWAHLKLVNFDGQPPDREQRLFRLASGCLSLLAAGLGLLWALADEESLTWHDHMSRTFPTPY